MAFHSSQQEQFMKVVLMFKYSFFSPTHTMTPEFKPSHWCSDFNNQGKIWLLDTKCFKWSPKNPLKDSIYIDYYCGQVAVLKFDTWNHCFCFSPQTCSNEAILILSYSYIPRSAMKIYQGLLKHRGENISFTEDMAVFINKIGNLKENKNSR